MAKKQLTRTLDTTTAAGQEEALRLLQQAAQLKTPIAAPAPQAVFNTAAEPLATSDETPQYESPKKRQHPNRNQKFENVDVLQKATQMWVHLSSS